MILISLVYKIAHFLFELQKETFTFGFIDFSLSNLENFELICSRVTQGVIFEFSFGSEESKLSIELYVLTAF